MRRHTFLLAQVIVIAITASTALVAHAAANKTSVSGTNSDCGRDGYYVTSIINKVPGARADIPGDTSAKVQRALVPNKVNCKKGNYKDTFIITSDRNSKTCKIKQGNKKVAVIFKLPSGGSSKTCINCVSGQPAAVKGCDASQVQKFVNKNKNKAKSAAKHIIKDSKKQHTNKKYTIEELKQAIKKACANNSNRKCDQKRLLKMAQVYLERDNVEDKKRLDEFMSKYVQDTKSVSVTEKDRAKTVLTKAVSALGRKKARVTALSKTNPNRIVTKTAIAEYDKAKKNFEKVANRYVKQGVLKKGEVRNVIASTVGSKNIPLPTRNQRRVTPSARQAQGASMKAYGKYIAGQNKSKDTDGGNKDTPNNTSPTNYPGPTGGGAGGGGGYGGGYGQGSARQGGSSGSGLGSILGGVGSIVSAALQRKLKQQRQPKRPEPPKPACNVFGAERRTVRPGESVTLRWALSYSEFAAISPSVGRVDPRGGTVQVSPNVSTDYILQSQNRYGYARCPVVHITVLPSNSLQQGGVQATGIKPEVSCTNRVGRGASGIVLWQCPAGSRSSSGSSTEYADFSTRGQVDGSARVAPRGDSTFVVRCRDSRGRELGRNSCKMRIDSGDETNTSPQLSITSSKSQVQSGDVVTIAWEGIGTNNCRVTGPDGFSEPGNKGEVTGRMLQTSTFTLTCSNDGQQLPAKEVTIQVL